MLESSLRVPFYGTPRVFRGFAALFKEIHSPLRGGALLHIPLPFAKRLAKSSLACWEWNRFLKREDFLLGSWPASIS